MARTITEIFLDARNKKSLSQENLSTKHLKFFLIENDVKKSTKRKVSKKTSSTPQNITEKYCPYCFLPVSPHEKFCSNCNLPVPDKNYLIEDSETGFLINVDTIIQNIENKVEPPPPVPIKTAQGNELVIKPILTNRRFVSCPLPYTPDRHSGYCSLRKFTVIDFETANMYPDSVCQIGIAVIEDNEIKWASSWLIRPPYNDFRNEEVHGITLKKVEKLMTFAELWEDIKPFIENNLVGAYNARFDIECLFAVLDTFNIEVPLFAYFDILQNIREKTKPNKLSSYRLTKVAKHFGIEHNPHDALSDVIVAAKIQFECESPSTNCFMYGKNDDLIHLFSGDVILPMVRRELKESFEDYSRLLELVDIAIKNGSDKAKCLKLQGEILEKNDIKDKALEKYLEAYELNPQIGVKSRIQKLQKVF